MDIKCPACEKINAPGNYKCTCGAALVDLSGEAILPIKNNEPEWEKGLVSETFPYWLFTVGWLYFLLSLIGGIILLLKTEEIVLGVVGIVSSLICFIDMHWDCKNY